MNCPKCRNSEWGNFLSETDRLWCEFEAEVISGYLHTVYWCKRCDWNQQRKFDPELIHLREEE